MRTPVFAKEDIHQVDETIQKSAARTEGKRTPYGDDWGCLPIARFPTFPSKTTPLACARPTFAFVFSVPGTFLRFCFCAAGSNKMQGLRAADSYLPGQASSPTTG